MEFVNKIFLVAAVMLVLAGGYLFLSSQPSSPASPPAPTASPEIVDFSAGFAIFTRGTFRVFTEPKYHNRTTYVFIESERPNIVRIKKAGVTWADFFKTLPAPMQVTPECLTTGTGQVFCSGEEETLKFYLNGEKVEDLLEREIRDGDRALISFGSETEAEINLQLQKVP